MKISALFERQRHPRLFWNKTEIGALRAKAGHPAMAVIKDQVLARCCQYIDPGHPSYIDNTLNRTDWVGVVPNGGRHWQKLPDLILASILTYDERWPVTLAAILRILTRDDSPIKAYIFAHAPATHHDGSLLGGSQRNFSTQCGMVPLLLDLLWHRLPPADREAACAFLSRDVVNPFLDYLLDADKDAGFAQNLGVNLGWWEFYTWVWSLAVIYDAKNPRHRSGMEAVARRIRHGMYLGSDESGVIGEGPFYAGIEIFGWWTAAEILRRMGLCDFWKSDARFRQIMKSRIYYQLPNGHGILDHGDTERINRSILNNMLVMLLHSARTGDPVYQAAWDRLRNAVGDPGGPGFLAPLGALGHWLWYDPGISSKPIRFGRRDWPLAPKAGRFGLHFVRSGWRDDDLYFAFFAAGRQHGSYIHQHSDAGHFALAALGELFCAGRGYGHTPARYHNVLAIDGREPQDAPDEANGESWRGGYTLAAAHGRLADYIAADLAWQWHAAWYQRCAMVVRMPGTDPYVVILDHCNKNNDWASYDWQFQVQAPCRAELAPGETRATVYGRKHRLELAWSTYGAGEYPKPQEIELRIDHREHIYAAEKGHPHHSQSLYDCLIARLSGYCGALLAALVPRRNDLPQARIEQLHAPRQLGLVIDHGDVVDTIVANPLVRRITVGGIDAEANTVVVRRSKSNRLVAACAAECFALAIDGTILLPPRGCCETLFEHRPKR